MAVYRNPAFLQSSTYPIFDLYYAPGQATPNSGIYRCYGCGHEIASNQGNPLPPQNHHQHAYHQGEIRWQLIVATA